MSAIALLALLALALGDSCPYTQEYYQCSECDASTPQLCTACKPKTFLSGGRCITACSYNDASNPDYDPNCEQCDNYTPDYCMTCKAGYLYDYNTKKCKEIPDCTPDKAPPNCQKCKDDGSCAVCKTGYYMYGYSTACTIDCSKMVTNPNGYNKGCVACTSDGACSMCDGDNYYWVKDYSGSCVPKECASISGSEAVVCSGRGTCEYRSSYFECKCTSDNTDRYNKCACSPGYVADVSNECIGSPCPNLTIYDNCDGCRATAGSLVCSACKKGFYMPSILCQQTILEGCESMAEGSTITPQARCMYCKLGYDMDYASGRCILKRNHDMTNTYPHCATIMNGKCTLCDEFFYGLEGGCQSRCPDANCAKCDEADPTKCLVCGTGTLPKCLPTCYNPCHYPESCTATGTCAPTSCLGIDANYYNNVYGPTAGMLVCSGAGTCESVQGGSDYACKCNPGYEAETMCFTCEKNYYKNSEGKCVERKGVSCPANCESCEEDGKCRVCLSGWSEPFKNCATPCSDTNCARCSLLNPATCLSCKSGFGSDGKVKPPCLYQCSEDCLAIGKTCVQWANNTGASCMVSQCANPSYPIPYECNTIGKCIDDQCECTDPNMLEGPACSTCAPGYSFDSYDKKCLPNPAVTCNPACYPFEVCTSSNGQPTCIPRTCLSQNVICGGRGECQRSGICKCTDPNANPAVQCRSCLEGFVTYNGKCIRDDCKDGPNSVPNCKDCIFAGTYICAKCNSNYALAAGNVCFKKGLAGGAIAGIVVAVVVILAVAGFLIYWFGFKRRAPKRASVAI